MRASRSIVIDSAVADSEQPAIAAMAEQLAECLGAVSGQPWNVEARLRDGVEAIDPRIAQTAIDRPGIGSGVDEHR